jgi:hypothetical protein
VRFGKFGFDSLRVPWPEPPPERADLLLDLPPRVGRQQLSHRRRGGRGQLGRFLVHVASLAYDYKI